MRQRLKILFLCTGNSCRSQILAHERRVRDEIRAFVETLPEGLEGSSQPPAGTETGPAGDWPLSKDNEKGL